MLNVVYYGSICTRYGTLCSAFEWAFLPIVVAFAAGKTTLDARCSVVNLFIFLIPAEIAFRLRWVNTGSFAMKIK